MHVFLSICKIYHRIPFNFNAELAYCLIDQIRSEASLNLPKYLTDIMVINLNHNTDSIWLRDSWLFLWKLKILIKWELIKFVFYRPSAPSLPAKQSSYPGVAVACTPSGVDTEAEATFLFLHCDGDVGQLTAIAAHCFPATEKKAQLD